MNNDQHGCGCLIAVFVILVFWFPLAPWLVGRLLKLFGGE